MNQEIETAARELAELRHFRSVDIDAREIAAILRKHFGLRTIDSAPVDEAWLRKRQYSNDGLRGWTKLVPPACEGGAIVTLHIEPPQPELDAAIARVAGWEQKRPSEWSVSLTQGMPDDPHYKDDQIVLTGVPVNLTRGDVLRIEMAIGLPQPPGGD